ncbi:MAG: hypothetical protein ABIP30_02350 [Ferruginibacter sp.]
MSIKNIYRYPGYLLLIIIFMVKVGVPVCKVCKAIFKTPVVLFITDSQQDLSKVSTNEKPELSESSALHTTLFTAVNAPWLYLKNISPFLPAPHCAVPTPPPWVRS